MTFLGIPNSYEGLSEHLSLTNKAIESYEFLLYKDKATDSTEQKRHKHRELYKLYTYKLKLMSRIDEHVDAVGDNVIKNMKIH